VPSILDHSRRMTRVTKGDNVRGHGRRLLAALLVLAGLLTMSATTTAGAKTAKKKTTKKKAVTTKKKTTATTVVGKVERSIGAPTATTQLRPVPKDYDPSGELIMGFSGAPSSLDPGKGATSSYGYMLYDRLTTIGDDLQPKPMLATGWSFPAKNVLEMKLRDDVTFEDGTKFDAAAVKANIERQQSLIGGTNKIVLRGVSSVTVVNPTTVRFNLSSGGAELPALFAQSPGMMVSPKVIARGVALDTTTAGGGSGCYVVDSVTPGDRAVFRQSKTVLEGRYWDKAACLVKKFTIALVGSSPQRINAIRSGDIDFGQITGVDVPAAKDVIKSGDAKGREVILQTTQLVLLVRSTRPPFDNKTFRDALNYAIDKVGLANGLYRGDCEPGTQFFGPTHWAHSKTLDGLYKYDPDKAQKMIKDSGVFNPTFTIQAPQLYSVPAQALAGALGDYGINAKFQLLPPSGDTTFNDGQADAQVTTMNGQVEPSNIINSYYLGGPKLASDPDGSLAKAVAAASDPTISQAAAAKLYDDVFVKLAQQSVAFPICNTHQEWMYKSDKKPANISDLPFSFSGSVDPRYLYVRK
jgi:peptide/nickel transport system substrate-binding protein